MAKQKKKPGPPGHGMVSMEPRAVRWRAQRDRENAEWRRATGNLMPWDLPLEGDGVDREITAIGVFKQNKNGAGAPEEPEEAVLPTETADDQEPEYHCSNCLTPVDRSNVACPICDKSLLWAEI